MITLFIFPKKIGTPESLKINRALNRVGHILYNVKAETAQQEKYYELILDFVSTGLLVLNDNGVCLSEEQGGTPSFGAEYIHAYPSVE